MLAGQRRFHRLWCPGGGHYHQGRAVPVGGLFSVVGMTTRWRGLPGVPRGHGATPADTLGGAAVAVPPAHVWNVTTRSVRKVEAQAHRPGGDVLTCIVCQAH
jgi:hypothetical protein